MNVSICIATYRRPELLDVLLESIATQEGIDDVELDIVIADNDSGESAAPIVSKWAERGVALRYVSQPHPNISTTRNLAVASAAGEVIVFIDDDERADPHWLRHLLSTMAAFDADAVFGPCYALLPAATPGWARHSPYFNLPVPETGTRVETGYTGNAAVKASVLRSVAGPFDERWGRTGGEDAFLFEQLSGRGARFVYCREAITEEHVPAERLARRWHVKRAVRTSNLYVRRKVALAEHPAFESARWTLHGLAVAVQGAARWLRRPRSEERFAHVLRAASGIGQLCGALRIGLGTRGY